MARMPPPHAHRADAARRRRADRAATHSFLERGTALFAQRLAHASRARLNPRHAVFIYCRKRHAA
eukprot:4900023-Prymnesium_polylepis.1